jgi:GNAT superfamily N-acetyltransferase
VTTAADTHEQSATEIWQILVEHARDYWEVVRDIRFPYGDALMRGYFENPFFIQRRLATGNEMFLLLRAGREDVGCVAIVKRAEEGIASILAIGVKKPFRRRGYGAKLLDHSIQLTRELGFRRLYANVPALNVPARVLFTTRRFVPEGLWRDLNGEGIDVISYALPLDEASWPAAEED